MTPTKTLMARSTIYVALGFLAPAVNFILLPIYAIYLSPADYALITLAALVQALLTNVIGLGANGAYARLYFDISRSDSAANALFTSSLFIFLLSSIAVLLLSFASGTAIFQAAFKNDTFSFIPYGYWVIGSSVAANIQLLVQTRLRNEEQVRQYVIWSMLFFLSSATGIFIGVVFMKNGALGSVAGRALGSLLPVLLYFLLYFIRNKLVIRLYLIKRLLNYGFPLVPYLLLNVVFSNVDKVFVERYFSLDVLGIYGFAVLIASVIEIFNNAVSSATYPTLYRQMRADGIANKSPLIVRTFAMVLLVSLSVNALLVGVSSPVIQYFINERYHAALNFFPLLCISYIPRALYIVWSMPLMFYKKVKVLPLINGFAFLLAVGSNFLMIPFMGVFSLPVSLFLSQCAMVIGVIFFSKRLKIDISSCFQLRAEHLLAIILGIIIIGATVAYNLVFPWIGWYILIVPIYFCGLVILFKRSFGKFLEQFAGRLHAIVGAVRR